MDFMKAMYVLWPDRDYIDKAIEAGVNTLFFAIYNPRPDIKQKTEFGTYNSMITAMRHYKKLGNAKVILMPAWWQPWYLLVDGCFFFDGEKYYRKTPCPLSDYYINWVMEYPLKHYKDGDCDGIFWDFEDYGFTDPERLKYFDDWNQNKFKCMCERCKGLSEQEQRAALYTKIYDKLHISGVAINGEYTYADPKMWKGFPPERWWVNAYTYKDFGVLKRIWKYTIPNRWLKNSRVEGITCGIWLEHFTAKASLKFLTSVGKSASTDGYWIYPQMRMSKNCYWRVYPIEPWSKHETNALPHTSFIDVDDPDYFGHLKDVNKKIDEYRKGWWFKIKRFLAMAFIR